MNPSPTAYTADRIAQLRDLVKAAPSVSVALDMLEHETGYHRDHLRRISRRFGIYHARGTRKVDAPAPRQSQVAPTKAAPGRKVRRLFYDIEVSPNIVLSWKTGFKLNIGHDSIIKERAIICIAWKWQGESDVHILSWDQHQDDKAMLVAFLKVANEADELVAHWGDGFDLPWFKTRCLYHGLITPPDYKTVDTCVWAKRRFYFNSNKLDYIAQYLGVGAKIKTSYSLWKDIVLNKCPKALALMLVYCKQDVTVLERVWERLSAVVAHKTHAGVLAGGAKWQCPRTGSTNVKVSKTRVTAGGTVQYQMVSLDDGTYYSISSAAHDAYQEAKQRRA